MSNNAGDYRAIIGDSPECESRLREIELEPEHYGGPGNYGVIEAIEKWGLGYHLGQVVKYIARAGKKVENGDAQKSRLLDLRKARWYLDREIARMEKGV